MRNHRRMESLTNFNEDRHHVITTFGVFYMHSGKFRPCSPKKEVGYYQKDGRLFHVCKSYHGDKFIRELSKVH